MSKTGKEWKEFFSKVCDRTLMEMEVSVHTLMGVVGFAQEFDWTGLNQLKALMRAELNKRGKEWGRVIMTINPACNKHRE